MNVFAKFDDIPSMILQYIKETKRYGHTVCGGIINCSKGKIGILKHYRLSISSLLIVYNPGGGAAPPSTVY